MFAKCFYSYKIDGTPIDVNVIKHMIRDMKIVIYPHKNGLFTTNNETFDTGDLSEQLLEFIEKFAKKNRDLEQFLITHIQEPHRLFYRLLVKNIPKTQKISEFLIDNQITKTLPDWLFDPTYILKTVDQFIVLLGKTIADIYAKKSKISRLDVNFNFELESTDLESTDLDTESISDSLIDKYENAIIKAENFDKYIATIEFAINDCADFIQGINLSRVEIEYEKFTDQGLNLVKKMFQPLYGKIGSDILNKLSDDIKLIHVLKFLVNKKLFD